MSVSAILPSSTLNQADNLQNVNQQRRTGFQQLAQALQSGGLTDAQQAFGALTRNGTNPGIQSVRVEQDLSAIGSALQSGNLAEARDSYSTIQQGLRNSNAFAAHHHHAHGGGGSPILTSGFPRSAGSSDDRASSNGEVFQPVSLTA